MRIASLLFFEIAAAILAAAGYQHGLTELAAAGLGLGGLAVLAIVFFRPAWPTAMIGLFGVLVGAAGLFHVPPLFCAGALAAALVGWDVGRLAPRVADASPRDRGRFALAYALRAAGLVGIGVLLVAAAGRVRVSLTFGSGLGLSFAVLVLAALFLRSLRRPRPSGRDATADRP
jgi:hypothetical protein